MSTYAVFGMTRAAAKDLAKKSVDKDIQKAGKFVPESSWLKMVEAETDSIMKSSKVVMLSNKFDAPQFAQDFKRLAEKIESRSLHIKAYCQSQEKSVKTGKYKMHWVRV